MIDPLARYHRQTLLPGIGAAGQERLARSTALVVGLGALGSVAADLLARAGVGRLVLLDRDLVELTNLQRQTLYTEADAAEPTTKAEAAARRLAAVNSDIALRPLVEELTPANVESRLRDPLGNGRGVDVIVDGTDNFLTRFVLNDAAVKLSLPLVCGGVVGTEGSNMVVLPRSESGEAAWERANQAGPCLRCLFGDQPPAGSEPTCETAGVLGPAAAMVAAREAGEAIKILVGQWSAVDRRLLRQRFWPPAESAVAVARAIDPDCPCCGQRRFEYLTGMKGGGIGALCGQDAVQIPAAGGGSVDLAALQERVAGVALEPPKRSRFLLRVQVPHQGGSYELTVFPDARAIVKGTSDAATARAVYQRYVGA